MTTTTVKREESNGGDATAANKCELDEVDVGGGPRLGLLGGEEGRRRRKMENGRAEDCYAARSLLMNETLKAPRRPRFHVVILRFIIHLSLPLSQHSLLSFLSYKQAAKAKKDQKSWKLPINLMKFHQPPAAIPDMESRGRASASGGIT